MAKDVARYKKAIRYGFAMNRAQKWDEAAKAFKIALREFSDKAPPYAGLGEAMLNLKQLKRALDCFKLATRLSGGDPSHLQMVADIQERQGQLSDASRTYMAVGEIMLKRRQLEDAVANWQRAIRLEPGLLGARQRLATVYQRQGNTRASVREYLGIARTLQMQGEQAKAMRMCQAALRLDPGNPDVLLAIELVRHGEAALGIDEEDEIEEVEVEAPEDSSESLADAVRLMADAFESEKQAWEQEKPPQPDADPVAEAIRLAQNQLAEEIFREEEDEDALYGTGEGLSKLERDALIGQGIDFQSRGLVGDAITCYQQAVNGGLELTAAHFTLGVLHAQNRDREQARSAFSRAAHDSAFQPAIRVVLAALG